MQAPRFRPSSKHVTNREKFGLALAAGAALLLLRRRSSLRTPMDPPYNRVSSGWGDGRAYRGGWHEGLDFPAPEGTPVRAAADGAVTESSYAPDSPTGRWISILHGGGLTSRYLHLSQSNVHVGQRVYRGQVIALSGATGDRAGGSFKPHLHFDLRLAEPMLPWYQQRFGRPSTGWGSKFRVGVGVPSEPLVPARYPSSVLATAQSRGVSRPLAA